MSDISGDWQDFLEPIDIHFGRFIERLGGGSAPWLFLTAGLLSRSVREGDVCLDLKHWAGTVIPSEARRHSARVSRTPGVANSPGIKFGRRKTGRLPAPDSR